MRGCEPTGDKTTSEIIRIVIAALLVYALVRAAAVRNLYEEAEEARRTLCSEVQSLREETVALERRLNTPPDEEEIEKLARDRLGLVMPNETIFTFTDTEKDSTKKEG